MSKGVVNGLKIKINDLKKMEQTLDKFSITLSRSIAQYAKEQLTKEYGFLLQKYYNDYYPKYYSRTYQLLNLSYRPYYHSPHGVISYGGVSTSTEGMRYLRGGYPPEEVISSFLSGYHGWEVPMLFSPFRSLCRFRDFLAADICHGEAGERLITEARAQIGNGLMLIKTRR